MRALAAFEKSGCNLGAIRGLEISVCIKITHGAQGIRVFLFDHDFEMYGFGAPEIHMSSAGRLKLGFHRRRTNS